MKILLTGCSGQIGWELERQLAPLGRVVAVGRATLDLTQPQTAAAFIHSVTPDVIVNAAAYTAVDRAESEPQLCFAVNADSVRVLADTARDIGALLVHYSTDYVFDGSKCSPYLESDATGPINTYGQSKLAGEQAILEAGCRHLILRTSWVYSLRGNNFLLTMLRLASQRPSLRVVNDQYGAPTWARDIAMATRIALQRPNSLEGLFHLTADRSTTWFEFARRILQLGGLATAVEPIPTKDYPTPAARPTYSVLDSNRFAQAVGFRIGAWDGRLEVCFKEYKPKVSKQT